MSGCERQLQIDPFDLAIQSANHDLTRVTDLALSCCEQSPFEVRKRIGGYDLAEAGRELLLRARFVNAQDFLIGVGHLD